MCLPYHFFYVIALPEERFKILKNVYFCREKLKVEVDNKGRKMCMNQMRRAFSTCRVPGVFRDQLITHFRTGMGTVVKYTEESFHYSWI